MTSYTVMPNDTSFWMYRLDLVHMLFKAVDTIYMHLKHDWRCAKLSSVDGKCIIFFSKIFRIICPLDSDGLSLISLPIYTCFAATHHVAFIFRHLSFCTYSLTCLLLLHRPVLVFFHNGRWDKNMDVNICSPCGFKHATSCSWRASSTLFFHFRRLTSG